MEQIIKKNCTQELYLGKVSEISIQSTLGPFKIFKECKIVYPKVVIEALGELYKEYNLSFGSLVVNNKEFELDYKYCSQITNSTIQIDMVGLSKNFLKTVSNMHVEEVKECLRSKIFEIENSLAMYQLLHRLFSKNDGSLSSFRKKFDNHIKLVRYAFGKPVALLAITEQKYEAMRQAEFGKTSSEILTDEEVKKISGFDKFFGPKEFMQHIEENNGECKFVLYVRSSDPVHKLKKPDCEIDHPLLGNSEIRKIIKENSITVNIDNPRLPVGHKNRINDTKEYMPIMGMAFQFNSFADIFCPDFILYLAEGKNYLDYPKNRLSAKFVCYLLSQGLNPLDVENGKTNLRFKPMKGAYGCYGHFSGPLSGTKLRAELKKNIRERGAYVIQPEMEIPIVINKSDQSEYTCIHRNFFSFSSGEPEFMGGFCSLIPTSSIEAQNGRNHGNSETIYAEIISS